MDQQSESATMMTTIAAAINGSLTNQSQTLLASDAAAATTTTTCTCFVSSCLIFLFLLVVLLFKYKNPFQIYIKFFAYIVLVQTLSLMLLPIAIFRPRNMKNFNLYSRVLNFVFKIFTIDMELENGEYLNSDKPYLLITNHQSSLDVMVMMKIWPRKNCTILAKKTLLYAGPFSLITWLGGMTFIDRFNSEKARSTINQLAERINEKNMRVWIFPEGTRNATTQLLPFKKGAFHLAIQAKVPIVCVVTSSYLNFYSKRERKFLANGKIKIRVLKPVDTCDLTLEHVNDLVKQMQERMQSEFDLVNREIGLDAKYYTKLIKADDNNNHATIDDKKKL